MAAEARLGSDTNWPRQLLDGLGNCMQTKLAADSNVSGNANVSTSKTDAMRTKPVGGALAMLTNVGTLKVQPVLPRIRTARDLVRCTL